MTLAKLYVEIDMRVLIFGNQDPSLFAAPFASFLGHFGLCKSKHAIAQRPNSKMQSKPRKKQTMHVIAIKLPSQPCAIPNRFHAIRPPFCVCAVCVCVLLVQRRSLLSTVLSPVGAKIMTAPVATVPAKMV